MTARSVDQTTLIREVLFLLLLLMVFLRQSLKVPHLVFFLVARWAGASETRQTPLRRFRRNSVISSRRETGREREGEESIAVREQAVHASSAGKG